MMMKKTSLWLVAATAAGFAFGFAGCGGTDTPMTTTCTADSQCAASEACHPVLRRCVTACTAAVDCPDSSRTCATFDGRMAGNDAGVRAFCQCATDALCERGSAGQVCQPATKICGAKCTASSDCPTGSTCDTMTGKCSAATTATDGGAGDGGTTGDAGVGDCTPGSCTAPQICDPTTRRCAAATACSAANPQPDTCAYGLTCSGAACAEAPLTATCANLMTGAPSSLAWNPATITPRGPVTVSLASIARDSITAAGQGFCGESGGMPKIADFSAEANLYAGSTNFPAMLDMLPAGFLNYVNAAGNIIDIRGNPAATPAIPPAARAISGYAQGLSNNNKNLRLRFSLCVSGTRPSSIVAGFYADKGNGVCSTLQ